jgi:hypothetical protein
MVNKDKGLNQRVTFMTDVTQREWLRKKSEESGAPLGELIRRAISSYMEIQSRRKV